MSRAWFLALTLLVSLSFAPPVRNGGSHALAPASRGPILEPRVDASLPADSIPDWYYGGDQVGDEVGYALGTAGDVNGDGYDDVIVGAPQDGVSFDKEGVVYVFYGGPAGLETLPDWAFGSGQQGSRFGAAVGTAGDVNGDGYDDIIVGAQGYKGDQGQMGAAFLFLGSGSGLSSTPDWTFLGDQKDAQLGAAVGTAGDVNDDGYSDVIVGERWYSVGQIDNGGRVLVFHGSDTGLSTDPDWSVEGNSNGAGFGSSVATAGDVNNDGYDDVVVGAPYYESGGTDVGAAFVFYGSDSGLITDPHWTVYGQQANSGFGASVGTAGQVNGDDYADVIVGAPQFDQAQTGGGAVFAYYGAGSGLGSTHNWVAYGDQEGSGFGTAVATAGDVDSDGYEDVVVGAHLYGGQDSKGAVFVYYGSSTGLQSAARWRAEGDKARTEFGYAVGTAGNVNGDAYTDLLVGAPKYRYEEDQRGRAFAFYGPLEPIYTHCVYLPLVLRPSP